MKWLALAGPIVAIGLAVAGGIAWSGGINARVDSVEEQDQFVLNWLWRLDQKIDALRTELHEKLP